MFEYLVHLYLHNPSVIEEQTTGHEILSGAWLHDLCFNLRAALSLFNIDIECCARNNEFNKQNIQNNPRAEDDCRGSSRGLE